MIEEYIKQFVKDFVANEEMSFSLHKGEDKLLLEAQIKKYKFFFTNSEIFSLSSYEDFTKLIFNKMKSFYEFKLKIINLRLEGGDTNGKEEN